MEHIVLRDTISYELSSSHNVGFVFYVFVQHTKFIVGSETWRILATILADFPRFSSMMPRI